MPEVVLGVQLCIRRFVISVSCGRSERTNKNHTVDLGICQHYCIKTKVPISLHHELILNSTCPCSSRTLWISLHLVLCKGISPDLIGKTSPTCPACSTLRMFRCDRNSTLCSLIMSRILKWSTQERTVLKQACSSSYRCKSISVRFRTPFEPHQIEVTLFFALCFRANTFAVMAETASWIITRQTLRCGLLFIRFRRRHCCCWAAPPLALTRALAHTLHHISECARVHGSKYTRPSVYAGVRIFMLYIMCTGI